MNTNTPVTALQYAVAQFPTKAQFVKALKAQCKRPLTWAHVSNWIKRGKGAPAEIAPDIEAVSGVRVELLRPEVSWQIVRGCAAPQLRRRILRAHVPASAP